MMNAEEQEYMDYLIHNRTQLTNQITRHLDELLLLQEKLDIAVKALKEYAKDDFLTAGGGRYVNPNPFLARKALKEMEE